MSSFQKTTNMMFGSSHKEEEDHHHDRHQREFSFANPLHGDLRASEELRKELMGIPPPHSSKHRRSKKHQKHQQQQQEEETPLLIAVKNRAPRHIINALLHLCPKSSSIPSTTQQNNKRRIPLHYAASRPTGNHTLSHTPGREAHAILSNLIEVYPKGVLERDERGRTPLHWLFMYHAESRSVETVKLFTRRINPKEYLDFLDCHEEEIELKRMQLMMMLQNEKEDYHNDNSNNNNGDDGYLKEEKKLDSLKEEEEEEEEEGMEFEIGTGMQHVSSTANRSNKKSKKKKSKQRQKNHHYPILPSMPVAHTSSSHSFPSPQKQQKSLPTPSSSSISEPVVTTLVEKQTVKPTSSFSLIQSFSSLSHHQKMLTSSNHPPPPSQQTSPRSINSTTTPSYSKEEEQQEEEVQFDFPKLPPNATTVPDSIHGCIPLHYAILSNASYEVVKSLILSYPDSIYRLDKWGRTALHWYLGASSSSSFDSDEEEKEECMFGNDVEINITPHTAKSQSIIELLCDDIVASHVDSTPYRRLPLHWAVQLLSRSIYRRYQDVKYEKWLLLQSSGGGGGGGNNSQEDGGEENEKDDDDDDMYTEKKKKIQKKEYEEEEEQDRVFSARSMQSSSTDEDDEDDDPSSSSEDNGTEPLLLSHDAKESSLFTTSSSSPPSKHTTTKPTKTSSETTTTSPTSPKKKGKNQEESSSLSFKSLKYLIQTNSSALCTSDGYGRTPLSLFFNVIYELQEDTLTKILQLQDDSLTKKKKNKMMMKMVKGAESMAVRFKPHVKYVRLLLQSPSLSTITSTSTTTNNKKKEQSEKERKNSSNASVSSSMTVTQDNTTTTTYASSSKSLYYSPSLAQQCISSTHTTPLTTTTTLITASSIEDTIGFLPLHYAASLACPSSILRMLIQSHPAALIHTGDEEMGLLRTPLHLALSSPYTARLQTKETIGVLLGCGSSSFGCSDHFSPPTPPPPPSQVNENEAVGGLIDGKLSLKMEDAKGNSILHLAAQNGASLSVLLQLLRCNPHASRYTNSNGDLPLHLLLHPTKLFFRINLMAKLRLLPSDNEEDVRLKKIELAKLESAANFSKTDELNMVHTGGIFCSYNSGWTSDAEEHKKQCHRIELRTKIALLLLPLSTHAPSLGTKSSNYGLLPLHIAVAFNAVSYEVMHSMLQYYPDSARVETKIGSYKALDLHVMRWSVPLEVTEKERESWRAKKELLFSYYPRCVINEDVVAMTFTPTFLFKDNNINNNKKEKKGNNNNNNKEEEYYRTDTELLDRCVQVIKSECMKSETSCHVAHVVDPTLPKLNHLFDEFVVGGGVDGDAVEEEQLLNVYLSNVVFEDIATVDQGYVSSSSKRVAAIATTAVESSTFEDDEDEDDDDVIDENDSEEEETVIHTISSSVDTGTFDGSANIGGPTLSSASCTMTDGTHEDGLDETLETSSSRITNSSSWSSRTSGVGRTLSYDQSTMNSLVSSVENGENGGTEEGGSYTDTSGSFSSSYTADLDEFPSRSDEQQEQGKEVKLELNSMKQKHEDTASQEEQAKGEMPTPLRKNTKRNVVPVSNTSNNSCPTPKTTGRSLKLSKEKIKEPPPLSPLSFSDKKIQHHRRQPSLPPRGGLKLGQHENTFYLSDVAVRLWVFLATFSNSSNPSDHYATRVENILVDLKHSVVREIVSMVLPDYAMTAAVRNVSGLTVRDCANVFCKAVIHASFYFVGRYDFTPPPPDAYYTSAAAAASISGGDNSAGVGAAGPSILIHKGVGGRTLLLRATEHTFSTVRSKGGKAEKTSLGAKDSVIGAEEEEEEDVGVEVSAMDGSVQDTDTSKTQFRITTRPVCVKFFQDRTLYEREVKARTKLLTKSKEDEKDNANGSKSVPPIVPILGEYDGMRKTRKVDRRFGCDIADERFRTLPLRAGGTTARLVDKSSITGERNFVDITKYSYAIVMPLSSDLDARDLFLHEGMDSPEIIRDLVVRVGWALSSMHSRNLIYCQLRMKNILDLPYGGISNQKIGLSTGNHNWSLTDFSSSCKVSTKTFMGKISTHGPLFASSVLPPEMFTKLDPMQLQAYESYWKKVKTTYKVQIQEGLVEPWIEPKSGDVYVTKCYYDQGDNSDVVLPPLPYELIPSSPMIDIWSFGVLLFQFCSGGHPLFPTNNRTGHMVSYDTICGWSKGSAENMVYDYVQNPLAQDILLHMLVPAADRKKLTMGTILSHPFFKRPDSLSKTNAVMKRIVDQRLSESKLRRQRMDGQTKAREDEQWINGRTTTIERPDLSTTMRLLHSPTEIMKATFNSTDAAPKFPYGFILLPYELVRNKAGRLTPASRKDVVSAEAFGKQILNLSKSCTFVLKMDKLIKERSDRVFLEKWVEQAAEDPAEAKTTILKDLDLDDDFADVSTSLVAKLLWGGGEQFVSNPIFEAQKCIRESAKTMLKLYDDSQMAYLYLVDEYNGLPIIPMADDTENKVIYPHKVTSHISNIVKKLLPFVQACVLHMRGVAGGVSGLVKLIFEGAYPHIPPSWAAASKGLSHDLDIDDIVGELRLLIDTLDDLDTESPKPRKNYSGDKELVSLLSYFQSFDPSRKFADLRRLKNGSACMWTTEESVRDILALTEATSVTTSYHAREAEKLALKKKDMRIAQLEKAVKELKFRLSKATAANSNSN